MVGVGRDWRQCSGTLLWQAAGEGPVRLQVVRVRVNAPSANSEPYADEAELPMWQCSASFPHQVSGCSELLLCACFLQKGAYWRLPCLLFDSN